MTRQQVYDPFNNMFISTVLAAVPVVVMRVAFRVVVASTATRWFNHEGDILRYVFFHSIALACLVGLYVTLQAYVWPFTLMVVH